MSQIKTTWYAAYGIEPEFSGCSEPTLLFDPVVKEQDGILLTWDEEMGSRSRCNLLEIGSEFQRATSKHLRSVLSIVRM